MEIQKNNSSLQQKLLLLKALRGGRLQQSEQILSNLTATSRTNPQLYNKFHSFLSQHRHQIQEINNEEKEVQPKIVLVQGSDDEWLTDDSVSISSQQSVEAQPVEKRESVDKKLFRNSSNTKSTTLLQKIKQTNKPFLVQTKPKDSKVLSNLSLKQRNNSSTKFQFQNKSLLTTLSKSNLLAKPLVKQPSKPYFPLINGAKSTLKLVNK